MDTECDICAEKLNKSTRKPVECILCEEPKPRCCLNCFSKFLLNSSNTDPTCMFCHQELTMDFVYDVSTKIFIEEYKNYRFEMKFSLEQSRLPETQDEANRHKWARQRDRNLKKLSNEKSILYYQRKLLMDDLPYIRQTTDNCIKLQEMDTSIRTLTNEIHTLSVKYDDIIHQRYNSVNKKALKESFVRSCPDDNCRGFLSTAYKCGTCNQYFCSDCNELKANRIDEEHVCNEEIKASLDLIKSDSKPCPKCKFLIFKISGCPQMWCIQCHTAFNWNTGLVDDGYVHNPEYFRYLRENGHHIPRNPNDIVNGCNVRAPLLSDLRHALKGNHAEWSGWFDYFNHTRWYILPNNARNFQNVDYSEYRIAYLNDEISKEYWKKSLKMRMKKDELLMERFLILDMFCNVLSDLFVNLIESKNVGIFADNAMKIFNYTNLQMNKLNKKFNSKDRRYFLDQTDSRIKHYFV